MDVSGGGRGDDARGYPWTVVSGDECLMNVHPHVLQRWSAVDDAPGTAGLQVPMGLVEADLRSKVNDARDGLGMGQGSAAAIAVLAVAWCGHGGS